MFYPFLMVDDYHKTWRGLLNLQEADNYYEKYSGKTNIDLDEAIEDAESIRKEIATFFKSYNEFILHYAKLTAPYIDAVLIGSETVKLINICVLKGKSEWEFPAIDCLIDLAGKVKQIFESVERCDIS